MEGELLACSRHGMDDRLGVMGVSEVLAHFRNHPLPKFLTTSLVNSFVANHCKFMDPWRHQNENPVALLRFLHAKFDELFLRGGHGILNGFAGYENPNFSRSLFFG